METFCHHKEEGTRRGFCRADPPRSDFPGFSFQPFALCLKWAFIHGLKGCVGVALGDVVSGGLGPVGNG